MKKQDSSETGRKNQWNSFGEHVTLSRYTTFPHLYHPSKENWDFVCSWVSQKELMISRLQIVPVILMVTGIPTPTTVVQ